MRVRHVIVDGREVRAYEQTPGKRLLFLHGTGGSGKAWFHQLRRLGEQHQALALDLPGYGDTPLGDVTSHDDYPAFVTRCLDAVGWEDAIVIGNSLGGRVALTLALDHPARVKGLVLVNASGIRLDDVPTMSPFGLDTPTFLRAIFHRPADQALVMRAAGAEPPWLSTARTLSEASRHENLLPRLHAVRVPTLVIWGAHDQVIPLAYGEALAAGIPGARLVVIEEAAHVPMLERPGEVNRAIAAFLEDA